MRILITGGAGFIGSSLTDELLGRGCEVLVLDDLSTGSMANLEGCRDAPGFLFVEGSACDPAGVAGLVASCTGIVHLAATVGMVLPVAPGGFPGTAA